MSRLHYRYVYYNLIYIAAEALPAGDSLRAAAAAAAATAAASPAAARHVGTENREMHHADCNESRQKFINRSRRDPPGYSCACGHTCCRPLPGASLLPAPASPAPKAAPENPGLCRPVLPQIPLSSAASRTCGASQGSDGGGVRTGTRRVDDMLMSRLHPWPHSRML